MGSGNWIVDNLNSALNMWNGRLAEIWQLLSCSPEGRRCVDGDGGDKRRS